MEGRDHEVRCDIIFLLLILIYHSVALEDVLLLFACMFPQQFYALSSMNVLQPVESIDRSAYKGVLQAGQENYIECFKSNWSISWRSLESSIKVKTGPEGCEPPESGR